MFEKEAEENLVEQLGFDKEFIEKEVNKLKNPNEKFMVDSLIREVKYAFQKGAEFGYNKANEWHYPSKGELPKCDEKTQLMFYVNYYYEINGETKTLKRTVLGFYKKAFLNDDVKLFVEKSKGYEDEHLPKDVIAWKEIVLPKEIE